MQVANEVGAFGVHRVTGGEGVLDAILAQVVAGGHLAAEGIAPVGDGHDVRVVGEGLHEHGHVEFGPAQRVGNRPLVAEVGQGDEHAVDLVTVAAEEVGGFLGVGNAFDAAIGRFVGIDQNRLDALLGEHLDNGLAAAHAQVFGEETAIAHNDA